MTDEKGEQNSKNEILVHLESIRALLEKDRNAQHKTEGSDDIPDDAPDESVPMLDDVVAGGLSLDESPLSERTVIDVAQGGLDDDLFQALLTDAWKDSAAAMLKDSRADIEQHRAEWSPSDTDALNEALKVRIDDTVRAWLRETVRRNMDQLRQILLDAINDQLRTEINKTLAGNLSGKSDSANSADDKYGK